MSAPGMHPLAFAGCLQALAEAGKGALLPRRTVVGVQRVRHVGADQEGALDGAHDGLSVAAAAEGLRDARDCVAHHGAARACAGQRRPPLYPLQRNCS